VTYSIVARDHETGQLGVAVQSCAWGTGAIVPWVEAGVGAVATQAFAETAYGPRVFEQLRAGASAADALAAAVAEDGGEAVRQVGVVDARGGAAAHTGSGTVPEAGHRVGDGYTVQANMMLRATVPDAMADAFERSSGDLATRLLAALDAAESEGGDFRGRQSGAIRVVEGSPPDTPAHGIVLDVRVDDADYPLDELRRLIRLAHAYGELDRAVDALTKGDADGAVTVIEGIGDELTHVAERPVVHALALALLGRADDARRAVEAYVGDPSVPATYAQRLRMAGMVPVDESTLEALFGPAMTA
jgi:uncharacterized Ntn-hydrolase superfamily protein